MRRGKFPKGLMGVNGLEDSKGLGLVKALIVVSLALVALTDARAGVLLQPYESPEWDVSTWINGDPGPLRNQRGRVVVIEFFQLWCPGCKRFSLSRICSSRYFAPSSLLKFSVAPRR